MVIKFYGVVLGLFLFLINSKQMYSQQVEMVMDTIFEKYTYIEDALAFKYKENFIIYDGGKFDTIKILDGPNLTAADLVELYDNQEIKKIIETWKNVYALYHDPAIDELVVKETAFDISTINKNFKIIEDKVCFYKGDSIFIKTILKDDEKLIHVGGQFEFNHPEFILVEDKDSALVYSVSLKESIKFKRGCGSMDYSNDYIVAYMEMVGFENKIIAFNRNLEIIIQPTDGYNTFHSNEDVAIFSQYDPYDEISIKQRKPILSFAKGNLTELPLGTSYFELFENNIVFENDKRIKGVLNNDFEVILECNYTYSTGLINLNTIRNSNEVVFFDTAGKVALKRACEVGNKLSDGYYSIRELPQYGYSVMNSKGEIIVENYSSNKYHYIVHDEVGLGHIIALGRNKLKFYNLDGSFFYSVKIQESDYYKLEKFLKYKFWYERYDERIFSIIDISKFTRFNKNGIFEKIHKGRWSPNYSLVNTEGKPLTSIYKMIRKASDELYIVKTISDKIGLIKVTY